MTTTTANTGQRAAAAGGRAPVRALRAQLVVVFLAVLAVALVVTAVASARQVAFASGVVVLATCALLIVARPSLVHANTVFVTFYAIYAVLVPWLYVTGKAEFDQGYMFVNDWALFTKTCFLAEAGLVAYGVGLWIADRKRPAPAQPSRPALSEDAIRRAVVALVVVGAAAWLVMFVHDGFPLSSLLGKPPNNRYRSASLTQGGFGYLLALTYATNVALLLYVWAKPRRSLFSVPILGMLALTWVSNGLIGSRLLLLVPLAGLLVMRILSNEGRALAGRAARWSRWARRRQVIKLVVVCLVLFAATFTYVGYRTGGQGTQSSGSSDPLIQKVANPFDTSSTMYLVLQTIPRQAPYWEFREAASPVLELVPRYFDPGKYNQMWNDARFTLEFYGYDQYQAETVAKGPDFLADLYLNGGLPAIIGVMFVFGLFNEWTTRRARANAGSPAAAAAFVTYLTLVIPYMMKSGLFDALTYADVRLVPIIAVAVVLGRRSVTLQSTDAAVAPTPRRPSVVDAW